MGRHTKKGNYKIDWNRVRTFVVPDLEGFTVRSRVIDSRVTLTYFLFPLSSLDPM